MKKEPANSHIIYLTPMERTTDISDRAIARGIFTRLDAGEKQTHHVIATCIPDRWKDKLLKVTIEPAEAMAQDLALEGVRHWEKVEEQLDEELIKMRRLNIIYLR